MKRAGRRLTGGKVIAQIHGVETMMTGRGRLKLDGVPIAISFTVPVGICSPQALLPDAQRLANQVTDHAVAGVVLAGHRISCQKGCGACCRQMVPVSPVEARYLAALVNRMPPDRQAVVRERFENALELLAAAKPGEVGHPEQDKKAYRNFGLTYFRMGVPCPFLEEESCSIHADRPLVCREYLVTTPPAACAALGSGQVRQVPLPVHLWAVFGHTMAPDGRLEWMPLIQSLSFAAAHPEPPPALTGPRQVEAFLKALPR